MLMLATKKVSMKNQIPTELSWIENPTMAILKVFKVELSIFSMPILVSLMKEANLYWGHSIDLIDGVN